MKEEHHVYVEPQKPGSRPPRCNLLPLYQHLNEVYFDGSLPKIPVVFNGRLKASYGRCHSVRKKKIWKKYDLF